MPARPPSSASASAVRPRVVACVGETMAVLAPRPPGALESAAVLALGIGGAESNVAQYLAGHGVTARWISRVGDDPFGRLVREQVAGAGVDVTGVEADPDRPTGVYFKHRAATGNEVRYYRTGSAASAMTSAVLDTPQVRTAGLVHLSGITPALSAGCRELVTAALSPGPRRRPLTSFDVNWRPALWDDPDPGALLRALANRADLVFVGLDEAAEVWGCADPAGVRAQLPDPAVVVVKDSDRAATAFGAGEVATVPALTVDVVDVVGAGDAFAAGFLAGLIGGRDLVGQLRLGHLTAAAALRSHADHGPLLDPATTATLLAADDATWASAVVGRVTPAHATHPAAAHSRAGAVASTVRAPE